MQTPVEVALEIPATAFAEYARRPRTMTDHARQLTATLDLRAPTMADVNPMIETAAEAARGTDSARPIGAAMIAVLRSAHVILPGAPKQSWLYVQGEVIRKNVVT